MLHTAKTDGSFSRAGDTEIKRIMETIKGSSDMMRLDIIAEVAFETENLFAAVSAVSLTEVTVGKLADAGLWVSNFIRQNLDLIANGETAAEEAEELISAIKKFTEYIEHGEEKPTESTDAVPADAPADNAETLYRMHIYFYEDSRMENIRAYLLTDKLSKIGKVAAVYPNDPQNDPETSTEINENGYYIALETHLTREQLEKLMKGTLSVESVSFVVTMPNDTVSAASMSEPTPEQDTPAPEPSQVNTAPNPLAGEPTNIDCIRILSGGEIYSVPISCVRESFAANGASGGAVTHRGISYPYVKVSEKLGAKNTAEDVSDGMMLLISEGESTGCLYVDDILGTSTALCVPLPTLFDGFDTRTLGISGCALREGSDVSLVIDPAIFLQDQKTL
jgi:chemotaxis protein histidine kinase CheA